MKKYKNILGIIIVLLVCFSIIAFNLFKSEKITSEEAMGIVKEKVDFFVSYTDFPLPYCGEYNADNIVSFENLSYTLSETYKTKKEIDDYLQSMISKELIENQENYLKELYKVDKLYIEDNNELYCLHLGLGLKDEYIADQSEFAIINITEDKIEANAKIIHQVEFDTEQYEDNYDVVITKKNNDWILTNFSLNNN